MVSRGHFRSRILECCGRCRVQVIKWRWKCNWYHCCQLRNQPSRPPGRLLQRTSRKSYSNAGKVGLSLWSFVIKVLSGEWLLEFAYMCYTYNVTQNPIVLPNLCTYIHTYVFSFFCLIFNTEKTEWNFYTNHISLQELCLCNEKLPWW